MMSARLAVLPFAGVQLFIFWLMRYLPVPIKNPLLRFIAIIVFPGAVFGIWAGQAVLYRTMTGIRVLKHDRFFMALSFIEYGINLCVLFWTAWERRKKN